MPNRDVINANSVELQSVPVSAVAPTDKQVLAFNAGDAQWEPADPGADTTMAGDVTGTAGANTVAKVHGVAADAVTTKGDLLVSNATPALKRLGVGSDGQVLTADSTQATGAKWATPAVTMGGDVSGSSALSTVAKIQGKAADVPTTKGDLYVYDGSVLKRVGVGADGQVLTADSTTATGVKWA